MKTSDKIAIVKLVIDRIANSEMSLPSCCILSNVAIEYIDKNKIEAGPDDIHSSAAELLLEYVAAVGARIELSGFLDTDYRWWKRLSTPHRRHIRVKKLIEFITYLEKQNESQTL